MGRLLTTRRSEWLPGLAVLGASVGIGALLGSSFGARSWAVYAALVTAALLLGAWVERAFGRRRSSAPKRSRGRLRAVVGGKPQPYDLASDERTKNQRYLM